VHTGRDAEETNVELAELDPADVVATDGRVPGERGLATRLRLLSATRTCLTRTGYRDLRVADIAREAACSPATFYQYFESVDHAVLVLAEDVAKETSTFAARVSELTWSGEKGLAAVRGLVEGFFDFWEDNRPVMRVVDLATEEGDRRFQHPRVRALNELTQAIQAAIVAGQRAGRVDSGADPMALAGVIVSMLVHVSAHRYGFEFWGVRTAALVDAISRILFGTVTGSQRPLGG
jgi:AcrR family transcriptional regulator